MIKQCLDKRLTHVLIGKARKEEYIINNDREIDKIQRGSICVKPVSKHYATASENANVWAESYYHPFPIINDSPVVTIRFKLLGVEKLPYQMPLKEYEAWIDEEKRQQMINSVTKSDSNKIETDTTRIDAKTVE